jgi:RHS repeat-associated protein
MRYSSDTNQPLSGLPVKFFLIICAVLSFLIILQLFTFPVLPKLHAGTNYLYTGQEYDPETGLYYYKSRYYDPKLGRFISPDPIIPDVYDAQNRNPYSYVANNPIRYTDPRGMCKTPPNKKQKTSEVTTTTSGATTAALAPDANPEIWHYAILHTARTLYQAAELEHDSWYPPDRGIDITWGI